MNNIRDKFEAWYQTQFSEIVDFSLFAPTSAYYKDDDIDEAWDVWQAATEQSQKEIEALQAREKVLVDLLGECVDTVRNEYNEMLELYSIYPHKQYDIQCQKELLNGIEQALVNVRGEVK